MSDYDMEPGEARRFHAYLKDRDWEPTHRDLYRDRYEIYLANADDGKGGDITRKGAPLLTFDEWMER